MAETIGNGGPTPDINRLRDLLITFYTEYDPAKLRTGLDINGMAEWTKANGMNALNDILFLQYQATIRPNVSSTLTPIEQMERISMVFQMGSEDIRETLSKSRNIPEAFVGTQETEWQKEENERKQLQMKIARFYASVDKKHLNSKDIKRLVNFAIFHGEQALNQKLVEKYGKDLNAYTQEVADRTKLPSLPPRKESANVSKISNLSTMPELGILDWSLKMLRRNLTLYYQKHDPEEISQINDVMDLADEIGREDLNEKLKLFYGESLTDFLEKAGNEYGHESDYDSETDTYIIDQLSPAPFPVTPASSKGSSPPPSLPARRKKDPPPLPAKNRGAVSNRIHKERKTPAVLKKRPTGTTDISLVEELKVFYQKHCPSRLENMQEIEEIAQELGRDNLNSKLKEIYDEDLDDIQEEVMRMRAPPVALPGFTADGSPQDFKKKLKHVQTGDKKKRKPRKKKKKRKPLSRTLLREQLKFFYLTHDPDKIDSLDPIVELGMSIGRAELNAKLLQLYGFHLDETRTQTDGFGESEMNQRKPSKTNLGPKERKKSANPCSVFQKDLKGSSLACQTCGWPKYAHVGTDLPPIQAKGSKPKRGAKHRPKHSMRMMEGNENQGERGKSLRDKLQSVKVKPSKASGTRKASAGRIGACNHYRLDMTGVSYGVCVCGYPRHEHLNRSSTSRPAWAKVGGS